MPDFLKRLRERRLLRARRADRDELLLELGALVFELHRQGRRAPELLQARAAELDVVDLEVRTLEGSVDPALASAEEWQDEQPATGEWSETGEWQAAEAAPQEWDQTGEWDADATQEWQAPDDSEQQQAEPQTESPAGVPSDEQPERSE